MNSMNNQWEEFDWIKTPEDWKNIPMNQKEKHHFVFKGLIYLGIIIIVSLSTIGIIYAYNDSFREWVHQYFASEKVQEIETFYESRRFLDERFLYYFHEDNQGNEIIEKMSIFDEGKFVEVKLQHYKGEYNHSKFSFDYYQRNDDIYTFNHEGYIQYTLYKLVDNDLYFGSSDNNLCSLNMVSGEITKITDDNSSVNFCLSPHQKNILINKNDAYWTVYNIKTKEERKVEGLSGYALNNEYCFMDDWTILCFQGDDQTRKIDLKSMTYQDFPKSGLYPEISLWYEKENCHDASSILVNMENQQTMTLPFSLTDFNYTMLNNKYLILQKENDIMICDLENNKIKEFHSTFNESYIDVICLDQKYIIFTYQNEYVVMTVEEIFTEL